MLGLAIYGLRVTRKVTLKFPSAAVDDVSTALGDALRRWHVAGDVEFTQRLMMVFASLSQQSVLDLQLHII